MTIELENDGTVKPGMSAGCTVTVSSRKDVLAVPIEAVYFDGSQAYVNLISSDGVVKTNIETGQSDANYVEITDGLQKGDTVQIEVRGTYIPRRRC